MLYLETLPLSVDQVDGEGGCDRGTRPHGRKRKEAEPGARARVKGSPVRGTRASGISASVGGECSPLGVTLSREFDLNIMKILIHVYVQSRPETWLAACRAVYFRGGKLPLPSL